jgi:hypothetical protein
MIKLTGLPLYMLTGSSSVKARDGKIKYFPVLPDFLAMNAQIAAD